MPQSYTDLLFHIVFSTKDRLPQLTPDVRERVFAYLGGIARNHNAAAIEIGGVDDHLHILARLHPMMGVAEFIRVIKSNSSGWVHETWPSREFAWQTGYGAFSVSRSRVPEVVQYIRNQEEHHKLRDFKAEFLELLRKHEVEYDERYIWA